MMTAFPNLFSPLTIAGVEIPNRILSTGHDTVMAHEGHVTDRLIAYHEARARGGAWRARRAQLGPSSPGADLRLTTSQTQAVALG
jgi:hypothetical protein